MTWTFDQYAKNYNLQDEINLIYQCFPEVTPDTELYEVSAGYAYVPKKGWAVQEGEEGVRLFHKNDQPRIEFEYLRQGLVEATAWMEKKFQCRVGTGTAWKEVV